jgi:hypothetical protein
MRRTFLTALLLAAVAAVVFAPSAMTKKAPPPPSGTFIVDPYETFSLTGMALTSDREVAVGGCFWVLDRPEALSCGLFGDNAGQTGQTVVLSDMPAEGYPASVPITIRLILADVSTGTIYTSDGMTLVTTPGTPLEDDHPQVQAGPDHAALGWASDGAILLSMNGAGADPSADSIPALGEGNFNATVRITAPIWTAPITNITGYSDGPVVDAENNATCGFHAVITYTSKKVKKGTAWAETALIAGGIEQLGSTWAWLDKSPFDPGGFSVLPSELLGDTLYQFAARIEDDATGDLLGAGFSSMFTLDPTTFVDGCPAPGQIVPTG